MSFVLAGVLIVSVRWRNTTFSGSLIDMGQHEWAPPRWATQILNMDESDWLIAVYILTFLPTPSCNENLIDTSCVGGE